MNERSGTLGEICPKAAAYHDAAASTYDLGEMASDLVIIAQTAGMNEEEFFEALRAAWNGVRIGRSH